MSNRKKSYYDGIGCLIPLTSSCICSLSIEWSWATPTLSLYNNIQTWMLKMWIISMSWAGRGKGRRERKKGNRKKEKKWYSLLSPGRIELPALGFPEGWSLQVIHLLVWDPRDNHYTMETCADENLKNIVLHKSKHHAFNVGVKDISAAALAVAESCIYTGINK